MYDCLNALIVDMCVTFNKCKLLTVIMSRIACELRITDHEVSLFFKDDEVT